MSEESHTMLPGSYKWLKEIKSKRFRSVHFKLGYLSEEMLLFVCHPTVCLIFVNS